MNRGCRFIDRFGDWFFVLIIVTWSDIFGTDGCSYIRFLNAKTDKQVFFSVEHNLSRISELNDILFRSPIQVVNNLSEFGCR